MAFFVCFFPGGKDKRGGLVLSFLACQPVVEKLKYEDLRQIVTYLLAVPR
jgi:hypothetical protein